MSIVHNKCNKPFYSVHGEKLLEFLQQHKLGVPFTNMLFVARSLPSSSNIPFYQYEMRGLCGWVSKYQRNDEGKDELLREKRVGD